MCDFPLLFSGALGGKALKEEGPRHCAFSGLFRSDQFFGFSCANMSRLAHVIKKKKRGLKKIIFEIEMFLTEVCEWIYGMGIQGWVNLNAGV